jgi:acyl-homoserine lactone synthase
LSGFVAWGLKTGVNTVIVEMQPLWILRLLQLHFRVSALGLPQQISGEDIVAVTAFFDGRTLDKLRAVNSNLRRQVA